MTTPNPAITALRRAAQNFTARAVNRTDIARTLASDVARDVHDVAAKPGQAFAWMIRSTGTHVVFVGTPERCFTNMRWRTNGCEPAAMSEYHNLPELADDMAELWFCRNDDMAEEFVQCADVAELRDRFLAAYLCAAGEWCHVHGTDEQHTLIEAELRAHGWL